VFSIVGTQFFSVGNTSVVDIQDLFKEGLIEGDSIQFFDGSGYKVYSYFMSTFDETWEVDLGPGWQYDETGTRADITVNMAEGFWLMSSAAEVTISLE
jgi:hypothetical protein